MVEVEREFGLGGPCGKQDFLKTHQPKLREPREGHLIGSEFAKKVEEAQLLGVRRDAGLPRNAESAPLDDDVPWHQGAVLNRGPMSMRSRTFLKAGAKAAFRCETKPHAARIC